MSKKGWFILTTVVVSFISFLGQLVSFSWRYQAIFGSTVATGFCLWFCFGKLAKQKKNVFVASFLPLSFFTGINLFYFILPQKTIWRILLFLAFGIGFYTILLTENVFLVASEFKSVPLYRAASTAGLLMMLSSAFFLFNALFSFHFSAWINGFLVFAIMVPLLLHFFWSVNLTSIFDQDNLTLGLTFSLIISEIAVVISFWPVGVGKGSLYLVTLLYVFAGIAQAYCRKRLFKKTIWEFLWVGLGTFLALLLVTNWRGILF